MLWFPTAFINNCMCSQVCRHICDITNYTALAGPTTVVCLHTSTNMVVGLHMSFFFFFHIFHLYWSFFGMRVLCFVLFWGVFSTNFNHIRYICTHMTTGIFSIRLYKYTHTHTHTHTHTQRKERGTKEEMRKRRVK